MGTLSIVKPTGVSSLSPNTRTNSTWPGQNLDGWQKANPFGGAGSSTNADLIDGLIQPNDFSNGYTAWLSLAGPPPVGVANTIIFNFLDLDAAIYSLDGAAPISYHQLPLGIIFRLSVKVTVSSTSCGGDTANHIKCELNNSMEGDVTSATSYIFDDLATTGFTVDPSDNFILPFNFSGFQLKFIQTYTNSFCDLRATPTGTGNLVVFAICGLEISGEYEIEQSTWTVTPTTPTLPTQNVITLSRPPVRVPSIPPVPPGTDTPPEDDTQQIEQISIDDNILNPNDPWVIVWTPFEIIFTLDVEWLRDRPTTITVKARFIGTEFDGFVPLDNLTITYADLSGIYILDSSRHSDLLYDRTASPTTIEVKIPAPFFVTSFFGDGEGDILHYGGTKLRITGQGQAHQILQSYDYVNTAQLADTTLRTANNKSPFVLANFVDQQASLRVYMDSIRDYMNVSKVIIFSIPLYSGYPQ